MKKTWIIPASVIGLLVAAALLRYGTLSPCAAVKQRIKAALLEEFMASETDNAFEAAGGMIGLTLAGPFIDSLIDSQSPMQCLSRLYRLETEGLDLKGLQGDGGTIGLEHRGMEREQKVSMWLKYGQPLWICSEGLTSSATMAPEAA